ncbi:hypothetical protein KQX54_021468 [Cotesia glomerata]|uniref:Uncharacterized protein n=1 Tax=Cotesia glomerata TaxID=32391 RepID=A0AAV7J9Z8_COTGL|nr:hypothetical protein KQX54_021468 [Cotesia glomerata]
MLGQKPRVKKMRLLVAVLPLCWLPILLGTATTTITTVSDTISDFSSKLGSSYFIPQLSSGFAASSLPTRFSQRTLTSLPPASHSLVHSTHPHCTAYMSSPSFSSTYCRIYLTLA